MLVIDSFIVATHKTVPDKLILLFVKFNVIVILSTQAVKECSHG